MLRGKLLRMMGEISTLLAWKHDTEDALFWAYRESTDPIRTMRRYIEKID